MGICRYCGNEIAFWQFRCCGFCSEEIGRQELKEDNKNFKQREKQSKKYWKAHKGVKE